MSAIKKTQAPNKGRKTSLARATLQETQRRIDAVGPALDNPNTNLAGNSTPVLHVNPLASQHPQAEPFCDLEFQPKGEQDERADYKARTQFNEPEVHRALEMHLTNREVKLQNGYRDQSQLILYLYIFFYGGVRHDAEFKNIVAADVNGDNEQKVISDVKKHEKLVQRACIKKLQDGMEKLVAKTGGVATWEQASTSERAEFLGQCFDESPLAIFTHVFDRLQNSVNYQSIFFGTDDEMRDWQHFVRYRFVRMCEAIFSWQMLQPDDDVSLLLCELWRDIPIDEEIHGLVEKLGGLGNVPCWAIFGRPSAWQERGSIARQGSINPREYRLVDVQKAEEAKGLASRRAVDAKKSSKTRSAAADIADGVQGTRRPRTGEGRVLASSRDAGDVGKSSKRDSAGMQDARERDKNAELKMALELTQQKEEMWKTAVLVMMLGIFYDSEGRQEPWVEVVVEEVLGHEALEEDKQELLSTYQELKHQSMEAAWAKLKGGTSVTQAAKRREEA